MLFNIVSTKKEDEKLSRSRKIVVIEINCAL
jgi:hypothetical protein